MYTLGTMKMPTGNKIRVATYRQYKEMVKMRKFQLMTLLEVMGVEYSEKETNKEMMKKVIKAEKAEAKAYKEEVKALRA